MANELVINYPTGSTLYALLFDATGQIYNGSTFEEPVSANWATYDIAMSEVATATGIYRASMPAVAAGSYGWVVRKQAGGSPAVTDTTVGTGSLRWTGTAEEAVPAAVNVTLWKGATAPAMTGDAYARLGAPAGASVSADIAAIDDNVWSYATRTLTQSSTSTTDSTAAGSIARRRGDSWSISLTVGTITGYTSLWFTAKWDRNNTDAQSVLQIKKNASGIGDGLMYVNGATAADATKASITISDASTGAIVIVVDETVTDDLPPAGIYYDIQVLVSGTVSTPDSGTLTITADVTRSIS